MTRGDLLKTLDKVFKYAFLIVSAALFFIGLPFMPMSSLFFTGYQEIDK